MDGGGLRLVAEERAVRPALIRRRELALALFVQWFLSQYLGDVAAYVSSNRLDRFSRIRKEIQDIGFCTYKIFPGGITPRLEDIIVAVNPYWEITEVKTRRVDYQKTCQHWLDRMKDHKELIVKKWGTQVFEDYDRYLSTCVHAFDKHFQSLAQYQLRRID